jgi:hypothetical protein
MKQQNDEEKQVLINEANKNKLALETEYKYKLFQDDINRVIYVLKK